MPDAPTPSLKFTLNLHRVLLHQCIRPTFQNHRRPYGKRITIVRHTKQPSFPDGFQVLQFRMRPQHISHGSRAGGCISGERNEIRILFQQFRNIAEFLDTVDLIQ